MRSTSAGKLVGFGCQALHEPTAGQPGVLAILGELREAILERGEVGLSKTEGLAQGIGLVDISLECVQRIDVVERAQLIEPQDVAVHELRTLDEIADQTAALGNLDAVGLLSREDGGVAV